jgi:hypothetical protein
MHWISLLVYAFTYTFGLFIGAQIKDQQYKSFNERYNLHMNELATYKTFISNKNLELEYNEFIR